MNLNRDSNRRLYRSLDPAVIIGSVFTRKMDSTLWSRDVGTQFRFLKRLEHGESASRKWLQHPVMRSPCDKSLVNDFPMYASQDLQCLPDLFFLRQMDQDNTTSSAKMMTGIIGKANR